MKQQTSRLNLARKYRPFELKDVVGQSLVVKTLEKAIETDRIAPAYLFSGPRGTGKTTCARIFARAASCWATKLSERPCGECASCLAYEKSQAIDLLEIDGASHTGVDDVRSLIESVAYKPSVGKRKVFIIDEVHMLSNAAFNALLKTLEEPPSHVLFLFATTEIEKIPATVLSRVQRLELRRLKVNEIHENLKAICSKEQVKANDDILYQIALAADGGLRDAQTLLDQSILLSGSKQLDGEVIGQFLGTIGVQQEIEILQAIGEHRTEDLLKKVAQFAEQGKDLPALLSRLLHWSRCLLVYRSTSSMELLEGEFSEEQITIASRSFQNWSIEDLDQLYEVLSNSYERIKKSDRPRIVVETTLIRASRIILTDDIRTLVQNLRTNPAPSFASAPQAPSVFTPPVSAPIARSYAAPVSAPVAPATAVTGASPVSIETAEGLIQEIKKKRPSLAALLVCAEKSSLSSDTFQLSFSAGHFAFKQLSEKILKKELQDLAHQVTSGKITQVILEESTSTASKKSSASSGAVEGRNFMTEAKRAMLNDPLVQKASELLEAKVESVTIEGVKIE